MEWRETGILLSLRKHGETSVIAEALTPSHGRHAGVIRGGISRKMTSILQLGAQLDLTWRARLDAHIGTFTVEPQRARAHQVMGDRAALEGLNAACALLCVTLGERDPHPGLYAATEALFDVIGVQAEWPLAYLKWEMLLLEEMGYGLDLSACAVTGATEDLIYISPRTGRAVSKAGAGEFAPRLLPLADAMRSGAEFDLGSIQEGLRVTAHFLTERVLPATGGRDLPPARARLATALTRQASGS